MTTYNYFKVGDIVTCKELKPTFSTGTVLHNQNGRVQIKDNVTGLIFYRDEKQIKFVDEKLNNKVIMTPSIIREIRTKIDNLELDTKMSLEDWISIYRVLGKTCYGGVDEFIKKHGFEDREYTLTEMLQYTKNQYGSQLVIYKLKQKFGAEVIDNILKGD